MIPALPTVLHPDRYMNNMQAQSKHLYSFCLLLQAEDAARRLGFEVRIVQYRLDADAHVHPLQPLYESEQSEDSAHEKDKTLARLTEELGLGSTDLQATAVFAKPLAVVSCRPMVFDASILCNCYA